MKQKLKVGAVSYLNTKPLIYGFKQGMMADDMELVFDYPAKIAAQLLSGEIDMGLVPVAIIPFLQEHHIVSDYCIGAVGEVASVCLFSDVPINEVSSVLLDYQSKTSVALCKVLLKEYWKVSPNLSSAYENYEQDIKGTTAGLVIGDRALKQRLHSKYVYDLGSAWIAMTGLPFVFAAWVSSKRIDEKFNQDFNRANQYGLDRLPDVIREIDYRIYNLETYYTKNISYQFSDSKRYGLELFLGYISHAVV